MTKALEARNLIKTYNTNTVLKNVSLALSSGKVHALVGHNGAGKSTLLRMLAGVEQPDMGELLLNGESVRFSSPKDAYDRGIACVYQELRVINQLTVAQNIFLGQEIKNKVFLKKKEMFYFAQKILKQYNLDLDPDTPVYRLSHAQKQFLEIIAALQRKASFLFLDEPTTSLEFQQIGVLLNTLKKVAIEQDIGIVLVTHKLNEVYAVADTINVLCDGELVLTGSTSEISRSDVMKYVIGDKEQQTIARDNIDSTNYNKSEPPILDICNLTTEKVKNIKIRIFPGQIVGLYGLVGSGRTELLRAIYGLDKVISGELKINGKKYSPKTPKDAIKNKIAFLTEDRRIDGFIPDMNCIDNAAITIYESSSRMGFIQRKKVKGMVLKELHSLQIRGDIERPMRFLSGGNQQKILFTRASLQDPVILLLDEPTKGIDIGVKREIYQIVRRWACDRKIGVLVVSTEEEEILQISDTIAIFSEGKCIHILDRTPDITTKDLRNLAVGEGAFNEVEVS